MMENKFLKFLFIFVYGKKPKLNMYNDSFKTKFSAFLTLLTIALSITYLILSFIEYFKSRDPLIVYYKENDKKINRTIDLKDSLMFSFLDSNYSFMENQSVFYFEVYYYVQNEEGENYTYIPIERCELGKNIDIEFKKELSKFNIEEYFCLSDDIKNLSLFHVPDIERSSLLINIMVNESANYTEEELYVDLINANSIIDHRNKDNPFPSTYFTETFIDLNSDKYNTIFYSFQYLKYISDNGFLFQKNHIYNGKAFNDVGILKGKYDPEIDGNEIGSILIDLNEINFDYYSRTYSRIQTFLIDVLSIIGIFIAIGDTITDCLLSKQMAIDLVKYLLSKKEINSSKTEKLFKTTDNNIQYFESSVQIKNNIENNKNIYLDNNKSNYLDINKSSNYLNNNKSNYLDNQHQRMETNNDLGLNVNTVDTLEKSSNDNDDKRINVLKKLNYYYLLKSYLCCKDKKTKLINCCDNLILDELSVAKILKRLNDMGEQINCIINILNENSLKANNTPKSTKFDEINALIDDIISSNKSNKI